MKYKIMHAINIRNKTVLALDKPRQVQDLACTDSIIDEKHYHVDIIHPDEAVVIEMVADPSQIIGKTIELVC